MSQSSGGCGMSIGRLGVGMEYIGLREIRGFEAPETSELDVYRRDHPSSFPIQCWRQGCGTG
jgi:hypothetical protein